MGHRENYIPSIKETGLVRYSDASGQHEKGKIFSVPL
jgi:hypothetical protein